MCVAYPGKIIEIDQGRAKVDFSGNLTDVNIGLVRARPGDWVLVHAGMATCSMPEEEAQKLLEIFTQLEEIVK